MDNNQTPQTKGNAGWAVLGFFFPLIGFILWLVWRNEKPGDSKMAGKGTLIGVIVYAVICISMVAISACTFASFANDVVNNIPSFN